MSSNFNLVIGISDAQHMASNQEVKKPEDREYGKVLIVDDHEMVRVGLLAIMVSQPIAGRFIQWIESANLHDAIDICKLINNIDLVLLDLNLADAKGLQGLAKFKEVHPHSNVAVMTGTQDEFIISQARSLGAIAYISKSKSPDDIRNQLNELIRQIVHSKKMRLPIKYKLNGANFSNLVNYKKIEGLGARHIEILELVLSGCSNQEISKTTHLTLGTVKNYVSKILSSLDVSSRAHLISLFH